MYTNHNIFYTLLLICIGHQLIGNVCAKNLAEGKYRLESSDNFDNYLKELGVNFILRNLAGLAKPVITISRDCNEDAPLSDPTCTWTIVTSTLVKTNKLTFKLDQQVSDTTLDDRQVKTTFTVNGDKLVETERGSDGRVTVITRTFTQPAMLVDLRVNAVQASSVFKREN